MTIQYQGNENYKIWTSSGENFLLNEEDLKKISELNFSNSPLEALKNSMEELEHELERVKEKRRIIGQKINDLLDDLCGVIDQPELDIDEFLEVVNSMRNSL